MGHAVILVGFFGFTYILTEEMKYIVFAYITLKLFIL